MVRADGVAYGARLQPRDTTEPAGWGGVQSGCVVPLSLDSW